MVDMDSEHSERIVLGIVTSLNTRFVVVPLRSESVGDIRGEIKSYHMELFPTWGEVDVNALEIELLGGRSRVTDHIQIGHLFRKASQALVFAELIPSSSNTLSELPRLKLAGATELNTVSEHELRPNSDEKLTQFPLDTRGPMEGHVLPVLGTSSHSNLGKSDHGNGAGRHGHGCGPVVVERQWRKKKREIDELENVNDVGEMEAAADCATAEVVGPVTKKSCTSRGPGLDHNDPETMTSKSSDRELVTKSMLFIESTLKPSSTDSPGSCQQLGPPLAKKGHEEIALLTSNPTEKDVVVKSAEALDVRHESNKSDGSGSNSQSDYPNAEKLQAEPGLASLKPTEDSVTKTLMALESKRNSSSADLSDNGGQLDPPGTEKVQEEPALGTSKLDDMKVGRKLMVAEASSGSSSSESEAQIALRQKSITRGKKPDKVAVVGIPTPEKKVPSGGLQNLNVESNKGSLEIKSKSKHSKREKRCEDVLEGGMEQHCGWHGLSDCRYETDLCSGTTSGGSRGATGGQKENPREKSVNLQGKHHSSSSSDGNNEESDPKDGSKSGGPREISPGKDSDQTTSDGDSSLQSSEGSESEDSGSTSDESDGSEEMPPRGRNMDFSTPKDGIGGARSLGRRSFGALADIKYQHLLDSQDGFDELISLSQQKLKGFPASQLSVAEPHDSLAPLSLADDSFSIDVVPDTQVSQHDFTVLEPVEKPSMKESVAVSRSAASLLKTVEVGLLPSVNEELILFGADTTEKVLEPGEEAQAKPEDSQQICAAVQLARMSMAKGMNPVLETSSSKKRTKRNQGVSSLGNHGLTNVQDSTVEGVAGVQSEKYSLQEGSNQDGESPIGDAIVISLHEVDQTLATNRLSAPNQNVGVGEELENILLALEGAEEVVIKPGNTTGDGNRTDAHLPEEVASEADLGRKKHGKRRYKVFQESETEVPQEDTGGPKNRVEEEPSRGSVDLPENTTDEPANKEHSGKNSSFEYRDLRKKSGLATTYIAVEKKALAFKQEKGPKSLNRKGSKGAVEEHAEPPGVETYEPVGAGPGNSPSVSILNNKEAHHEERSVLRDADSPSELIQRTLVELQLTNSLSGKKKMKKDRSEGVMLENRSGLNVEANRKHSEEVGRRQLEDTKHGNLELEEEPSGLVSKRESKDAEIEKEGPTAVGSQGSADVQLNGKPAQKKKQKERRLAVEFAENSSRLKQSSTGKKDRASRQDQSADRSTLRSHEIDFVSDGSLQHVQDTKEEDMTGNEERLVSNEDNEADKESPIVLDERKNISKKSGRAANSSKKIRNLEISLTRDQNTKRTQKTVEMVGSEDAHVFQLSTKNVEAEHPTEDVPASEKAQRTTLGMDGAKMVPSSLGEKMKKSDKLKKPKKQSKPDVAQEMEQLDDEDHINRLRTEVENQRELSLKKKRKKKRDLSLEPSVEAGNSEGAELVEAHQVDMADHEDQLAAPESPEIVKKLNLKENNGRPVKNRARKTKVEEESLHKEDGAPLQKKKALGSKNSELSPIEKTVNLDERHQIMSAASKKRVKLSKSREGDTGNETKAPQKNVVRRLRIDGVDPEDTVHCPHGCGREFSKKTSAYFRHQKSCVLTTPFGRV